MLPTGDGTWINLQRVGDCGPIKHWARSSPSLAHMLSLRPCIQRLQLPFLWLESGVHKCVTCVHTYLPNSLRDNSWASKTSSQQTRCWTPHPRKEEGRKKIAGNLQFRYNPVPQQGESHISYLSRNMQVILVTFQNARQSQLKGKA